MTGRRGDLRIALHLAARHLRSSWRRTALGWAWPLVRAGAQLAVFSVVFSSLLDGGIEHYAAHVFVGLVAFTWLLSGLPAAASSIVEGAALLRRPGFPSHVLPLTALLVAGAETLLALPFVVGTGIAAEGVHARLLLVLPVMGLQLLLLLGPALLLAICTVHVRDVAAGLSVALLLLFYATPVVYDVSALPDGARGAIEANPATALVGLWRAAVLGDPVPGPAQVAGLVAVSVAAALTAAVLHRRLAPGYLDAL